MSVRNLIATVPGQTSTSSVDSMMARGLTALVTGLSATPIDTILILAYLGGVMDPTIESATPCRTFTSNTTFRSIHQK